MPRSLISSLLMPSEGFHVSPVPTLDDYPVRSFLPTGYESNYAYPLVVLFHGQGVQALLQEGAGHQPGVGEGHALRAVFVAGQFA